MSDYKICQHDIVAVHYKLLEILVEVDRICRKYQIRYTLEGGTLLGAIKYEGFVPWDDDLDIVMLREDYERFLQICKKELSYQFFLENNRNSKELPIDFTKIRMNHTLYVEENSKDLSIHHGLFLDIFPIDNVKLKLLKPQINMIRVLNCAREYNITKKYKIRKKDPIKKKDKSNKNNKISSMSHSNKKKIVCVVISILPIKWINHLSFIVMTLFNSKKTEYVFELCTGNREFKPLNRKVYEELIEVEFMGKKFFASKHYEEFLQSRFGDISKLPPIEKRVPSHNIIKCKL